MVVACFISVSFVICPLREEEEWECGVASRFILRCLLADYLLDAFSVIR